MSSIRFKNIIYLEYNFIE